MADEPTLTIRDRAIQAVISIEMATRGARARLIGHGGDQVIQAANTGSPFPTTNPHDSLRAVLPIPAQTYPCLDSRCNYAVDSRV